ncbi:MAG: hypothetical protein KGL39_49120, partial [Patescibacteria group bacterium]|nr:hypothetical protein [Patescibacteria group bacterium]
MTPYLTGGLGAAAAAFITSWVWLVYKVSGVGKRKRSGKRYTDLEYQRGLLELEERKNTLEAQRQAISGSESATRVYAIAKGRKNQGMGAPQTTEGTLAGLAIEMLKDGTKRRTAGDIRLELMEARAMKRLEREMDDDASGDGMTGKERMIFGLVEAVASAAAPAL